MNISELREQLMHIAESFMKWIEDTAKEYNMSENQVQELIKRFLMG